MWSSEFPGVAGRSWLNTAHQGPLPAVAVAAAEGAHGLRLVANGLTWSAGDEVLLAADDYPATVLPFRRLAGDGVRTRTAPRELLDVS